ncbi:MAG: phage holin family protein, partial [Cellulomonadaceae bacterium]
VIRILVNALAIWLTTLFVNGFEIVGADTAGGQAVVLLVVALLFALVNAIVRPIVAVLSLPLYILTLGLFTLIVNALMLLLTEWITSHTDWGIRIDGFWTAVWAALLISIFSFVVNLVLPRTASERR